MFEQITPESIKKNIFDALKTEIDTREGSYTDDLTGPMALEIWKVYQTLEQIIPIVYVDETSGKYIDMRCSYYGIVRKDGIKAKTVLTVAGKDGTAIPKQTQFLSDDNLAFVSAEEAMIHNGSAAVLVEAKEVGANFNVGAGEINRQFSSISGVASVTNEKAAAGGTDQESDAALVQRLYAHLQKPATSGNARHYEQWALEVEGVGAAKITPLADGPGTVGVLIVGPDKKPVLQEVANRCLAHIEEVKPIGASVRVDSAQALSITVSANVTTDGSVTIQSVAQELEKRAADYLESISFVRYELPYSRIAYLLADIDGVSDYQNLLVNGGSANIRIAANEVPVLANNGISLS